MTQQSEGAVSPLCEQEGVCYLLVISDPHQTLVKSQKSYIKDFKTDRSPVIRVFETAPLSCFCHMRSNSESNQKSLRGFGKVNDQLQMELKRLILNKDF